ncbi:MAG: hypothetical protein K5839_06205 [Treponemataceae bacterium]|nr:hypothetical protein [Treponemataceae bacterium]
MKKILKTLLSLFIALCLASTVFAAEEDASAVEEQKTEASAKTKKTKEKKVKEKKVKEKKQQAQKAPKEKKPFPTSIGAKNGQQIAIPKISFYIDEGFELSKVTRVILQEDRSNYVFEDQMLGIYCTVKTDGFAPINPLVKVTALMPMSLYFNDCKLKSSTFNFGLDGFLGFDFRTSFYDYVFLNFAPGFHAMYEKTDRYNLMNLGLGAYISAEMPIAYEWTIVLGGQFSYDWGNFGDNSLLETYDRVWQTGIDLGVRYSKKKPNNYNYLNETAEMLEARRAAFAAKKAAKKAAIQAKKDAKKAAAEAKKAAQAEENAKKQAAKAEQASKAKKAKAEKAQAAKN